ncbi:MAG: hypothetical protein J6C05_02360 [Prevotella sp.]|nr:hypothetical protein [Prevotella sp.]
MRKIYFLLTFVLIGLVITSCSDSDEPSSDDISSILKEYKWVCKTSDNPMFDDDYDWVILDDYVITLYFVSDYECVIGYYRKHTDSDDGISYTRDAQTVRYSVQGSTILFENSDYTEFEFTFTNNGLISQNSLFAKASISTSDREWIAENFEHIQSDQEISDYNNIKKMVLENVEATGYYSDYVWHIKITSTLHNVIKNKKIEYGIGHGDVNGITHISVENEANMEQFRSKYKSYKSGDKVISEFEIPFFLYYLFSVNPPREDYCEECAVYYIAYLNLIDEGQNNWSSDEEQLYRSLKKYLGEFENKVTGYYCPSVQVLIGDKSYMVKEF